MDKKRPGKRGEGILASMDPKERERALSAFESVKHKFAKPSTRPRAIEPAATWKHVEEVCAVVDQDGHHTPVISAVALHITMRDAALVLSDEDLATAMRRITDLLVSFPPCLESLGPMVMNVSEDLIPEGYDVADYRHRLLAAFLGALASFPMRQPSANVYSFIAQRILDVIFIYPPAAAILATLLTSGSVSTEVTASRKRLLNAMRAATFAVLNTAGNPN